MVVGLMDKSSLDKAVVSISVNVAEVPVIQVAAALGCQNSAKVSLVVVLGDVVSVLDFAVLAMPPLVDEAISNSEVRINLHVVLQTTETFLLANVNVTENLVPQDVVTHLP